MSPGPGFSFEFAALPLLFPPDADERFSPHWYAKAAKMSMSVCDEKNVMRL